MKIKIRKNSLKNLNEDIELTPPQQPFLPPPQVFPIYSSLPSLTQNEKWGVFLLHSKYFIQGIPFGFFALSIHILLIEAGIDFSDVGLMSLCLYPFCQSKISIFKMISAEGSLDSSHSISLGISFLPFEFLDIYAKSHR